MYFLFFEMIDLSKLCEIYFFLELLFKIKVMLIFIFLGFFCDLIRICFLCVIFFFIYKYKRKFL